MSAPLHFTVADLELLADDGNRYEIIEGELYVSRQPDWQHQLVSTRIVAEIWAWDPSAERGVPISAPGVIFASDEAVVPDIVWVSRERFLRVVGADGKLHAAPELVIEILSAGEASEQRDRELKRKLYSRHGVEEYWIVDWRTPSVEIYRRENASLRPVVTLAAEDILTSPRLPGFARSVAELCAIPT